MVDRHQYWIIVKWKEKNSIQFNQMVTTNLVMQWLHGGPSVGKGYTIRNADHPLELNIAFMWWKCPRLSSYTGMGRRRLNQEYDNCWLIKVIMSVCIKVITPVGGIYNCVQHYLYCVYLSSTFCWFDVTKCQLKSAKTAPLSDQPHMLHKTAWFLLGNNLSLFLHRTEQVYQSNQKFLW